LHSADQQQDWDEMKFAICNEIFEGWNLDRIFPYAKSVGYDAVEIAPFTIARNVTEISAGERSRIRDSAVRAGVAVAGLHWVLVQTEGMSLTSPNAETRRRTARYFVELVNCCADLGGTRLIVGSPKQRNLEASVTLEQASDWAFEVFRDSVQAAAERSVVICIEPLAPNETNFLNSAAEAVQFAERFASPAMSVILDVKAMSAESKPIPEIIRGHAGKFEYFHANDSNLRGPGFGSVDFFPIAAALRDARYDGTVSVEVFKFDEGPERIAKESRDYLRKTFEADR